MICPACGCAKTRITNCRNTVVDGESYFRRRRECSGCKHRFTTYESYDIADPDSALRIGEARKVARTLQEILSA